MYRPVLNLIVVSYMIMCADGTHTTRHVNTCIAGMDYPESCPQPLDPPDRTLCCREGYTPACCQERAITVCGSKFRNSVFSNGVYRRHYDQTQSNRDPGPEYNTRWCPGPEDDDDETYCMPGTDTVQPSCVTHKTKALVVGLSVGGVVLFIVILGVVLFVFIRR